MMVRARKGMRAQLEHRHGDDDRRARPGPPNVITQGDRNLSRCYGSPLPMTPGIVYERNWSVLDSVARSRSAAPTTS